MESLFHYFLVCCLLACSLATPIIPKQPLQHDDFCKEDKPTVYKYEKGREYVYDYVTETQLWTMSLKKQSKSKMKLNSTVVIQPLGQCYYQVRMEETSLSGESLDENANRSSLNDLNNYKVVFRMNQQGELDGEMRFDPKDTKQWSRNIKRAIVSILQVKSKENLRDLDELNKLPEDAKSATVFETDAYGRCRTTYKLTEGQDQASNRLTLNKIKSLHGCDSVNKKVFLNGLDYAQYKAFPEFELGKMFTENYECNTVVENNLIDNVQCQVESKFKANFKSEKGTEVVVKQTLTFRQHMPAAESAPIFESWNRESVQYSNEEEFTLEDEVELSKDFDVTKYMDDVCENGLNPGFFDERSNDYKYLVMTLRNYKSSSDLEKLLGDSNRKCPHASLLAVFALAETKTEESFQAIFEFMDQNTESTLLISPLVFTHSSENLIKKLNEYLRTKEEDFKYLNKLYIIYSKMIKTWCTKVQCTPAQLNDWSSFFEKHLKNDCSSEDNLETIVTALKSIGNIGYFEQTQLISSCASKKENPLEIRINAIEALRRFSCKQVENLDFQYDLLQDTNEDPEVRITSFLSIMRCSDESAKYNKFSQEKLADFLINEADFQLYSFMRNYLKDHDLTEVVEKRQRNQGVSSYEYTYTYNLLRNSANEVEASVIYAPGSYLPRSIRLNVTTHMFGMSINPIDVTIRLEGLSDVFLNQNYFGDYFTRLLNAPEEIRQLVEQILTQIQDSQKTAMISLSVKIGGTEMFYYLLNSREQCDEFVRDWLTYSPSRAFLNKFSQSFKQPLANGLIFEASYNFFGSFVSQVESNSQAIKRLLSTSIEMNTHYRVGVNNKQKMAFKYENNLNGRLMLDLETERSSNRVSHTFNVRPIEKIPVLSLIGRTMRLHWSGVYTEIEDYELNDPLEETESCYNSALKLDFCYRVKDVLDNSDDEADENEDENETNDDDQDYFFSDLIDFEEESYNYEFWIRNQQLIRGIKFDFESRNSRENFNFTSVVSTIEDESNSANRQMKFTYKRENTNEYGQKETRLHTELSSPTDRLTINSTFSAKNNLQQAKLQIENTFMRLFSSTVNLRREVSSKRDMIPKYDLEAQINDSGVHLMSLKFNTRPDGNSMKSALAVYFEQDKLVEATLNLTQSSLNKPYWSLDFNVKPLESRELNVNGQLMSDWDKSNMALSVDYSYPHEIKTPFRVSFSHLFDMNANNSAEFTLTYPKQELATRASLEFALNEYDSMLDSFKFRVTDASREPLAVYYTRKQNENSEFSISIDELNIDLTEYSNAFARDLYNLDRKQMDKFSLKLTNSQNRGETFTLRASKNGIKFMESVVAVKQTELDARVEYMSHVASARLALDFMNPSYVKFELSGQVNKPQNQVSLTGKFRRDGMQSDLAFNLESSTLQMRVRYILNDFVESREPVKFDFEINVNTNELVRTTWSFQVEEKSTSSELRAKFLDKFITLKSRADNKSTQDDFNVEFEATSETHLQDKLKLNGNVNLSSRYDIELNVFADYSLLSLPRPVSFKFKILNLEDTQMNLEIDLPNTPLNHKLKLSYNQDLSQFRSELAEVDQPPVVLAYAKTQQDDQTKHSLSLTNLNIKLEDRNSVEAYLAQYDSVINSASLNLFESNVNGIERLGLSLEMNERVVSSYTIEASAQYENLKETSELKFYFTALDKNANLTCLFVNDQSIEDINWSVLIKGESCSGHKLNINSKLLGNLEESNLKTTLTYSNKEFSLPRPASLKFSHVFTDELISGDLGVDLPLTPVNHNFNLEVKLSERNQVRADFKVKRPSRDVPEHVFYEVKSDETEVRSMLRVQFGLENFDVQVSRDLYELDNRNLNSFLVEFKVETERDRKYHTSLTATKNNQVLAELTQTTSVNLDRVVRQMNTNAKAKYLNSFVLFATNTNATRTVYKTKFSNFFSVEASNMDKFALQTDLHSKKRESFVQFKTNWYARYLAMQVHHSGRVHLGSDDQDKSIIGKLNVEIKKPTVERPQSVFFEVRDLGNDKRSTRAGFTNLNVRSNTKTDSYLYESLRTRDKVNKITTYVVEERLNDKLIGRSTLEITPAVYRYKSLSHSNFTNLEWTLYRNQIGFEVKYNVSHPKVNVYLDANLFLTRARNNATFVLDYAFPTRPELNLPKPFRFQMESNSDINQYNRFSELEAYLMIDVPHTSVAHRLDFTVSLAKKNVTTRFSRLDETFSLEYSVRNHDLTLVYREDDKYVRITRSLRSQLIVLYVEQNLLTQVETQRRVIDLTSCTAVYTSSGPSYPKIYTARLDCKNVMIANSKLQITMKNHQLESKLETASIWTEARTYEASIEEDGLSVYTLRISGLENGEPKQSEFQTSFTYGYKEAYLKTKFSNNFAMSSYITSECVYDSRSGFNQDYTNRFNCTLDAPKYSAKPIVMGYALVMTRPTYSSTDNSLEVRFLQRVLRVESQSQQDRENFSNSNLTNTFYWDYLRVPNKKFNLDYQKENGVSTWRLRNLPQMNLIQMKLNGSNVNVLYETQTGVANQFGLVYRRDTNREAWETFLERPQLSLMYERNYASLRRVNSSLTLGKLVRFNFGQTFSVDFVDPAYKYEQKVEKIRNKLATTVRLSREQHQLSEIKTILDKDNNQIEITVNGLVTGRSYRLNLGVFNETLANGYLKSEKDNVMLGYGSLRIVPHEAHNDVVLALKWNSFWRQIKNDILGVEQAVESESKSLLDEINVEISRDVRPTWDSLWREVEAVEKDYNKFLNVFSNDDDFGVDADSEEQEDTVIMATPKKETVNEEENDDDNNDDDDDNDDNDEDDEDFTRMHPIMGETDYDSTIDWLNKYNEWAEQVIKSDLEMRKYQKYNTLVSKPKLVIVEFNKRQLTREVRPFANDLVIHRPTEFSENLYQFYAEFRNYFRKSNEKMF